ncbi:hypothetical protein [Azospirillum brasilense]|uniref:hypothetical protein n=1 Tax=Azospirillum brasilense TaxID=192 RepID=UPI001FE54D9F|nr:hypothetical protein [Azospirillum brasilense]
MALLAATGAVEGGFPPRWGLRGDRCADRPGWAVSPLGRWIAAIPKPLANGMLAASC